MKILLSLALIIAVLTGCATGTAMQAECESKHSKFTDIYRCTYDSIAARNPSILQDARAKLYLLRGEQLAQEVEKGKISDIDAKVAWQRSFVEMKTGKKQDMGVTCTSQQIGNFVQTNCD